MKINLEQIFKELRDEQDITAESQKEFYFNSVWQTLKKITTALINYEKFSEKGKAEQEIIGGICNVAIFSMNCWESEPIREIQLLSEEAFNDLCSKNSYIHKEYEVAGFERVLITCAYKFKIKGFNSSEELKEILEVCAYLCDFYSFDFTLSMLEKIKELKTKKLANYELARIIETE